MLEGYFHCKHWDLKKENQIGHIRHQVQLIMPSSSNATLNVFVLLRIVLFSSLQHLQLTIAQESAGGLELAGCKANVD